MNKTISKLQFITDSDNINILTSTVECACRAGVDWIQFRLKNGPAEKMVILACEIKKICDRYCAKLIINDSVELASVVGSNGVHLGKQDMDVSNARKILGNKFIIGGTANTFEDIIKLYCKGVDYIGLGPLRLTNTKRNLSPVLGFDGYENIINKCIQNNINIPIIAIGGIVPNDVTKLLKIGVYGISVSSAIGYSKDIVSSAREFLELTENHYNHKIISKISCQD